MPDNQEGDRWAAAGPPPPVADVHTAEAAYRAHRARIYALCLRQLHEAAAAEDMVQETFVRAAPYLDGVRGDVGGYLAVTARRLCHHELARRRRLSLAATVEDSVAEPRDSDVETMAVDGGFLRDIWLRLSQRDRRVLAFSFCGFSLAETAHRTGMSVDAAGMAVSRARQRARQLAANARIGLPALFAGGRRPRGRGAASGHRWLRSSLAGAALLVAVVAGGDAVHVATGWPSFGAAADTVQTPPSVLMQQVRTMPRGQSAPGNDVGGSVPVTGTAPEPPVLAVGVGDPRTPDELQGVLGSAVQAVDTCVATARDGRIDGCPVLPAPQGSPR